MFNICPYPGLRPFTEEESIYFKGRDTHILQIIAQLEQKKFLMLTGASGDGKSSLVYAGVIPNAKAGFFKAKFNNWIVADFKPQRNPLGQLAKSLTLAFSKGEGENPSPALPKGEGDSYAQTEKELSYGFSSLINLYKNSNYYLNTESPEYVALEDKEKKTLKRKAANLLILADQFEEFFTNPENYSKGVPSKEAQIVINLLIETAKMALEQNIPIYIICTMRSDYIGQCASFRGLPEMIGFSQFFVPRLKRKEIHQVIEDPALLSGNKISNRLIETLINEMSEGFDQLPVMQHTLNALWNMADKGNEEMDLLHLSKLVGISPSYLPKEDKPKFDTWFETLTEQRKAHFKNYSLEQVLSAHADNLYESALAPLSFGEEGLGVRPIIKTAFQCLTKMDEGRAVRNRMTLQEITEIINHSTVTTDVVNEVLKIFRQQGNTFISPFLTDKPETANLKPETVLDITHESLIRNWQQLKEWANEEYENLQTWQDFQKQLKRWIDSGKKAGYLLPIGPLTFFENWFNTAKPNKYWFARYDESDDDKETKLKRAADTLNDVEQFIKRSARKLFFSRTVIKYGAGKLISWFGILLLIITCTYFYFDYRKKQNPQVLQQLEERGIEILSNNKVDDSNKARFVITYERFHPKTFESLLNNLHNDETAFDIALNAFMKVDNFAYADSNALNPMAYPLLHYMSERLENILNQQLANKKAVGDENLERLNKYVRTCVKIKTLYHKDSIANKEIDKYVFVLNNAINSRIDGNIDSLQLSSYHLNQSIQLMALLGKDNKLISIDLLLAKISPFENDEAKKRFEKMFPKEIISMQELESGRLYNNGGYYILGILYIVEKNYKQLSRVIDSLTKDLDDITYGPINLLSTLKLTKPDSFNLENRFFKKITTGNLKRVVNLLQDYSYIQKINTSQLVIQNYASFTTGNQEDASIRITCIAPYLLSNKDLDDIIDLNWEIFKKQTKGNDEQLIQQALYFKVKGMFAGDVRKNNNEAKQYFEKALSVFNNANKIFLENYTFDKFTFVGSIGNKPLISFYETEPLEIIFAFLKKKYYKFNFSPTYFDFVYNSKTFDCAKFNSNIEADLRNEVYYSFKKNDRNNYHHFEIARILNKNNLKGINLVDKDFLDLALINKAFEERDTTTAFNIFERFKKTNFTNSSFAERGSNRFLINQLLVNLALNDKDKELHSILNQLEAKFKRNCLLDITEALITKGAIEKAPLYLDEFFKSSNELIKEKDSHYGLLVYKIMAMFGTNYMNNLAQENIKDVAAMLKSRALLNFIRGVVYTGNYYLASQYVPTYISSANELKLISEIMEAEIHKQVNTTMEDMQTHSIIRKMDNLGWEQYDADFQKAYGADYEVIGSDDYLIESLD